MVLCTDTIPLVEFEDSVDKFKLGIPEGWVSAEGAIPTGANGEQPLPRAACAARHSECTQHADACCKELRIGVAAMAGHDCVPQRRSSRVS